MSINNNEKRTLSLKKLKSEIKQNLSKPQTLEEYFIVIGVDPKIATKEYLYNSSIEELNDYYSNEDFKPKILSKFPPINKQYINIDNSLIDLCFPEGYKLEKFYSKPKPVVEHFLLDNSFYSINYPLKYVTCLKIYESLENYFLLGNEIKDKLGDDYFHNTWKMNTGKKNKNDIIEAIGNLDENTLKKHSERFRSEIGFNLYEYNKNVNDDTYKNYYFPKIICLVSTQHYFNEQKQILKQIYQYYMENNPKKIPLEKKILTILFNIPIPPKGLLEIEYNLNEDYQKIKLKGEKMNKIPGLYDELNLIFSKFSINKLLIIIKFILFETKTLVFSTKINELSYFIYGIISLIFPLHYSFQVSSSIPNGAYDILESISPYFLGINTKFRKAFFTENKIDMNDLNLFIIDLDEKSIKIAGKDKLPDLPYSLYKTLHDGLEEQFGIKRKKIINYKSEINFKTVRKLFYDFFVNLLSDYDLYLKKDYFKNKLSNTGIKNLFKIKDFIESHAHNEKAFYKKFTETQMFSDFIYKKMIPKNVNEKLEVLFVDETLIKKNNKKLFAKKKSTIFLDSKEYEHTHVYEIPQSKVLSKREKNFFIKEEDRNNLLLYGQKVTEETNEKEYLFDYYLFPILNKSFFESPPPGEYFLAPDSILFSDVDRANTDILSKSMKSAYKNCNKKTLEEEMQNYIYLTYIELWAYSYWYLDYSEKDNKFNQMLEVLNKITTHEVELFDLLFEALNKFKEVDKILQLYDYLLKYKILPSSFIYSTVNALLNKNKLSKCYSNSNLIRVNSDMNTKQKKHLKRTFHSIKEGNLLGDKVIFYSKQPCPECDKDIDMIEISLNFKNMKKEIFWTQCPLCGKNIIPKIGVILGSELNSIKENDDKDNDDKENDDIFNTSKYSKFVLHSPYELKNNIKNIINKDGFKIFHLEYFKEKYPSLFWSCVWYFKMNKIDLDIILPYEWNSLQDLNNNQNSFPMNIVSLTKTKKKDEKNNNNNIIHKKKVKKTKKSKIKKYSNDNLLIHSAINLILNENNYRQSYNTCSISSLFDLYRKSTISSIRNSNNGNAYAPLDLRKSADVSKIEKQQPNNTIQKKQTMKISFPSNLRRIRLNTSSKNTLLSPCIKARKLFENFNSNNELLSIKENEDYYISSFSKDMMEENDEDNYINRMYSKKMSYKIFNFEDDEINFYEIKKNRSFCQNNKKKSNDLNEGEYKRNNSVRLKNIDLFSIY